MKTNRSRGQATLALNLVLAIFFVGTLAIVSYEISRIMLAREQLKHCVELAALAGETTIMSSTNASPQATARQVALNIFKQNSIHGKLLSGATEVMSLTGLTPGAGQAQVFFEFDDPMTKSPSATGNVIRVHGAYNYPLFSGGFGAIGISSYTVAVESLAALPALDLVICYDLSASMDDQTKISLVRRTWDPALGSPAGSGAPRYDIPTDSGGQPTNGPIGGVLCSPKMGNATNAMMPQNLDASNTFPSTCPKEFSETGPTGSTVPLRGVSNGGAPPGDTPPGAKPGIGPSVGVAALTPGPGYTGGAQAYGDNTNNEYMAYRHKKHNALPNGVKIVPALEQAANAAVVTTGQYGSDVTMYTDLVVNLDNANTFSSYNGTGGFTGYDFRNIGSLVEAARGNLESTTTAQLAGLDLAALNVTPKLGYKSAYESLSLSRLEPKSSIDNALNNFIDKLKTSTDCHLGLVTFNDRAGTSPTDTFGAHNISWSYATAGGRGSFPLPMVPLSRTTNNHGEVQSWITPPANNSPVAWLVPDGGTHTADALQKARLDLTNTATNARPGAMKAVLLITDGVPTRDFANNAYADYNNAPAHDDAMTEASALGNAGIPLFILALDQYGNLNTNYMTQYSETSAQGLCKAAGHGSLLHIDTWADSPATRASLYERLSNVARQLVSLIGY